MNFEPQVGDIILVSSTGILPWINRLLQNMLKTRFTHALVAIDKKEAVHSLPFKGVCISKIWDELTKKNVTKWKVLRKAEMAENQSLAETENLNTLIQKLKLIQGGNIDNIHKLSRKPTLLDEVVENAEKKYNGLFYLSRLFRNFRVNHVFCTQLIAEIFKKLGFSVSQKESDRVFPKDLENLKEGDGWYDVTENYKQAYKNYLKDKDNPFVFQSSYSKNTIIKALSKLNRGNKAIQERWKDIEEEEKDREERLKKISQRISELTTPTEID